MAATIEEYLEGLPDDVRARVQEVRRVVHEVVSDAGETISYAMPTFTLDGWPLVHVARGSTTSACTRCPRWTPSSRPPWPRTGAPRTA